jgi:hypothetical protein
MVKTRAQAAEAQEREQTEKFSETNHPADLSKSQVQTYVREQGIAAVAGWRERLGRMTDEERQRAIDSRVPPDTFFANVGGDGDQTTAVVGVILDDIGQFLKTFKDNPGRRILSIEFGVLVGVVVAEVVGLDIFTAILSAVNANQSVPTTFLGVLATGIVIGLGANPTHEVIRVLQEYKISRKAANAPGGGVKATSVIGLPVAASMDFLPDGDETAALAAAPAPAQGGPQRSSTPILYFN